MSELKPASAQAACSECGTPVSVRCCERPRPFLSGERLVPLALALGLAAVLLSDASTTGGRFDWQDPAFFLCRGLSRSELAEMGAGEREPAPLREELLQLSTAARPDRDPSAVLCVGVFDRTRASTRASLWSIGWPCPWLTRFRDRSADLVHPLRREPPWRLTLRSIGFTDHRDQSDSRTTTDFELFSFLLWLWLWIIGFLLARTGARLLARGSTRAAVWLRRGVITAAGMVLAVLLFLAPSPDGRRPEWPRLPYRVTITTALTLADIRSMPPGPESDRAIAKAVAAVDLSRPTAALPSTKADDLRVAFGFGDQAASTWEIHALGRWWPLFLISITDKGPPTGVASTPARPSHLRRRGAFVEWVSGMGAWPGRGLSIAVRATDVSWAATLLAVAYAVPRLGLALRRTLRARSRLRRGCCVVCGYPLPALTAVRPASSAAC